MSEALDRTVAEWRAKVAAMGMRAWPEWKAAPDTAIPPKIRSRVILVWGRVCYLTGAKIVGKPPEYEHVVPLAMGGENREGNIRPVSPAAHKGKTAQEQTRKAKADAQRAASVATKAPKASIPSPPKPEKPTTKADQIRALREAEYARRFG